jgi:hypothetical protein
LPTSRRDLGKVIARERCDLVDDRRDLVIRRRCGFSSPPA